MADTGTTTKTPARPTAKAKRARHASAQATYMQRKREEGKEWLATWVPGDAKESFKKLAKSANDDETAPSKSYVSNLEEATGQKVPAWALKSQTLLNIWLIAENQVAMDIGAGSSEAGDKKDKKKKKKKKK